MRTRMLLLVGLVCLAGVLAGCGGGGGGGATPGVTLNIGADTTPILTRSHTPSRVTALITKLDQGATVTAYDFKTGATLDTGTIGANGFCSLQLTPGLTVVVVVIGSRDGKDYRLSVIIPMVPSVDSEYIAYPVTTIAAEAIAEKYFREGTALDQGTVDAVLEKAGEYVESHPDADYSIGGGVISGTTFGAEGNLDETELAEVIAAVPTTIVAKYVTAKNAVQQIKEAGIPIAAMVTLEPADIQALFTEEVEQSYGALAERLSQLILPSIMADLIYGESKMPVFGLTMGQAYKVVDRFDGRVVIADDSAKNIPGQITITDDLSGTGTVTLVAKKTSTADWRLTQTSAGDAQQLYEVNLPRDLVLGVNPSASASFSFKDSEFTTPVTFVGSASAVGPDEDHYTRMSFTGQLTTPQLAAAGTFQATFVSSVPAGADPYSSIYEWPISASMSNASITLTGGGTTVRLAGTFSATAEVVTIDSHPELVPRHVAMSGSYSNSHSGFNFSGSITADATGSLAVPPENLAGTIRMQGQISREDYPTYRADLTFTKTATGVTADIDLSSVRGGQTLTGTLTGTASVADGLQDATLALTNQAGVLFTVAVDAEKVVTGTVKLNGETLANIVQEGEMLKINFTDGTFDTIPFGHL